MRLVSWNCCRGPAAKLSLLVPLAPSIAVVQECPRPDTVNPSCLWSGDNPRQGIAVLSSSEYRVEPIAPRAAPRYTLPFQVSGPRAFLLLAVWSKAERDHPYVKGIIRAVELYEDLITAQPTVVIGDFNSNSIWNRRRPGARDHGALVAMLSQLGLVSAYHVFHGEEQGSETRPTLYLLRNALRPYHIDYCFVPESWATKICSVSVGTDPDWARASDHRPLIVDLSFPGVA